MELTIPAVVTRAAREFGEATALADPFTPGGPRLSYRSLGEQAESVAASLISAGLDPGDRVAVWGPMTATGCWRRWACWARAACWSR